MHRDNKSITSGEINDIPNSVVASPSVVRRRWRGPIPAIVYCMLIPLLLVGLFVSVFVLAVVHNALLFVGIIVVSVLVVAFLVWNLIASRSNTGLLLFLDGVPDTDLRTAADGQIVKITGRQAADFYITDAKSGTMVLVKGGNNSRMVPLIEESILVSTRDNNRELSLTLKKWLDERYLYVDSHLLRLEEGYIKEGRCITAVGMLNKKNDTIAIIPPPEQFSTGCLIRHLLLPVEIDSLLLRSSDKNGFMPGTGVM